MKIFLVFNGEAYICPVCESSNSMFPTEIELDQLNQMSENTLVDNLGIEFIEVAEDYIKARMPVDERTKQPMGLLHGGASLALAETMGSVASTVLLDLSKQFPVGLEINANHIKSAREGWVTGIVRAIHVGKGTHVWEIKLTNEKGELTCISRITIAILNHKH